MRFSSSSFVFLVGYSAVIKWREMKICVFVEPYQSPTMKSIELMAFHFWQYALYPAWQKFPFLSARWEIEQKRQGNLCLAGYMHHNITAKDSAEKTSPLPSRYTLNYLRYMLCVCMVQRWRRFGRTRLSPPFTKINSHPILPPSPPHKRKKTQADNEKACLLMRNT